MQVEASDLDVAIKKASLEYGVDADLLKAVAHLESSGGKRASLKHNRNASYDVGAFQINSVHWNTTCKAMDLTKTLDNARCAALLIKKAAAYCPIDKYCLGRYHSKTPSKKRAYSQKIAKVLKEMTDKSLSAKGGTK